MSITSGSTMSTPTKIEAIASAGPAGPAEQDKQPRSDISKLKSRNGIVLVPQPSDDKNDPLNWPQRKKMVMLATLCCAGFAGTALALANQLAFRDQAKTYHKSLVEVSYTVCASIAGIAYGPLLLNPLVHVFGRSSLIFWCLFLALICAVWAGCMTDRNDYEPFVASRLFTGIFGSAPSIFGAGPILDMFFLHERGRAYATFHISFLFGTIAGPTFGGFIVQHTAWPWVFWWIVIVDAIVLIMIFFCLHETGFSRHNTKGFPPRPKGWFADRIATFFPGNKVVPKMSLAEIGRYTIAPFQIAFSPVGILVGMFEFISYAWFVATHNLLTVFLEKPISAKGYGFTPQRNAFFIFSLWAGLITAQLYGFLLNDRIPLWISKRRGGIWKPEYRLYNLILPSLIILPISLGILGAGLQYHLHYMVLAVGAWLLTFSSMTTVPISVNYVIECFKSRPTECSAALGAYRLTLGLAVPFFINPWIETVGEGWAYGTMAFLTIASMGLIFTVIAFGDKLRAMSLLSFTGEEQEELNATLLKNGSTNSA